MNILSFFISYFFWHYSKALKNIFGIFSNFFWSTYNFFSISNIFRTFFSPWKRLGATHDKSGFEDFIGTIIVNTLMRIVGIAIRLVLIFVFLICILLLTALELAFFCIWISLPLIVIWLISNGIKTLI